MERLCQHLEANWYSRQTKIIFHFYVEGMLAEIYQQMPEKGVQSNKG
jgi:hypothetical protein